MAALPLVTLAAGGRQRESFHGRRAWLANARFGSPCRRSLGAFAGIGAGSEYGRSYHDGEEGQGDDEVVHQMKH